MNGLSKAFYDQDGSVDWLKSIVRTVCVYTARQYRQVTDIPTMTEMDHAEDIVYVRSIAARRAQRLYYRKINIMRGTANE